MVADGLLVGTVDVNVITQRVAINPVAVTMLAGDRRWSFEGVALSQLVQMVDRDDLAVLRSRMAMIGLDTPSFVAEYRTRGEAGSPARWVLARGRAYFDGDGTVIRAAGVLIDITTFKSDDQIYFRAMTSGAVDPLDELADLAIATRRQIDKHKLRDMRFWIDGLLIKVGVRLGERWYRSKRSNMQ